MERMIIQAGESDILTQHLPQEILKQDIIPRMSSEKTYQELKREAERHIIVQALEHNNWHITKTTKELGLASHSNLLKIMKRLEIQRPQAAE